MKRLPMAWFSRHRPSLRDLLAFLSRTRVASKLALFAVVWFGATLCLTRVATTAGGPLEPWAAAYHGARFFLLDAPGVPVSGPRWAVYLCRLLLFAAPAISGGIILDTGSRLLSTYLGRPAALLRMKGHAVVLGHGTHGAAIAEWMSRQADPLDIAVLDRRPRGEGGWMRMNARWCPTVCGEFDDPEAMRAVGAHRARLVIIATREQLANIAAVQVLRDLRASTGSHEPCKVIVLVDDSPAMEPLRQMLLSADDAGFVVELLDRFQLAGLAADRAMKLVPLRKPPSGSGVGHPPVEVVIVGAGRYGRAVMQRLAREHAEQALQFLVVDPTSLSRRRLLDAAIKDTRSTWSRYPGCDDGDAFPWVEGLQQLRPAIGAVFLCIDDDIVNLHIAGLIKANLADSGNAAPVAVVLRLVRPFGRPNGAESSVRLGENLYAFATHELVCDWLSAQNPLEFRASPAPPPPT